MVFGSVILILNAILPVYLSVNPNKIVNIKIGTPHIHFLWFTKLCIGLNRENHILLFLGQLSPPVQQYLLKPYNHMNAVNLFDFLDQLLMTHLSENLFISSQQAVTPQCI